MSAAAAPPYLETLVLRGQALSAARLAGLAPSADGLILTEAEGRPAATAEAESGELLASFPFDNLVPSWNVDLGPDAVFALELSVSSGGTWSEWVPFGQWGARHAAPGRRDFPFGTLNVDTLELNEPATALRWRLRIDNPSRAPAKVRLLAFAYALKSTPVPYDVYDGGPGIELSVEPRSQRVEQPGYSRDICSPTSLGMVLAFWGRSQPTAAWVERVRDATDGIYGDWPFNVAVASEEGLEAVVARLSGLSALEAELRAGRPVVTSVSFAEGELPGAPIKKTRGHLFVIRGVTANGDFIVNDPAAPPDSVRRVYKRSDIQRVWMKNKLGVAYLLRPRGRT